MEDRYIGDGVYASFDGRQIWLRTERYDQTHRIALDQDTFDGLLRYQRDLSNSLKPTGGSYI